MLMISNYHLYVSHHDFFYAIVVEGLFFRFADKILVWTGISHFEEG